MAWTDDNLTSLQTHVLAEEREHPSATGDFTWILSAVALAAKSIGNKVRKARIEDVIGALGDENVQGEQQQKLDVIANEIIKSCLGSRANIGALVSEEDETPTVLRTHEDGGRYAVLFDPLDGSSNLDVSVGVGTIFSIVRLSDEVKGTGEARILDPRSLQVAAGYVLYGSSTVFVLTTGRGVNMFVLDQSIGAFVLVKSNLRIPPAKKIYSINEAYVDRFPDAYRNYLNWAHDNGYSSRYIGSMVADIHRTLLKGGVFIYPPTGDHMEGKLRYLYEAMPMSMLIEQAGGRSISAADTRLLDVDPTTLHQRIPVVMGSTDEVEHVNRFLSES
ncbi:MAG: class 1 fructose-bisphosphatase [Phycisphaerales bacterium]|nr:class 1 fructose-bisphosphatase [Phycisphaerae bacterium]MCH2153620.1 class 1 fructose-bisphosphatase [Phycisphaerales bacterium]|tara:strand:- start:41 stop:1036 length:996 start_codon:yes stop_codon:yes gene_type:complete